MVFKIILCFLLVGAACALCLRSGIDWQRDRGKSWGEGYMKEYGLDNNKKD
ncbi:MAG: hypothetical protein K2G55_17745 [Lachnospiraceae bacterium]|nr:hypothetical protein [Lachnospiraceae bacterium]MDE7203778.1 hypothetical protein [Lachnospiraceae bacterium]